MQEPAKEMKATYNCVIIDDEPAPREILAKHIARHPALTLLQSFDEAPKALNYLRKNRPDIIFLDIEMPGLTGIQLIESLNIETLNFIFVTAHPQFALEAFDLDAADYISKPISYERFTKSIKKVQKKLEYKKVETVNLNAGKEYIQIEIEWIDWIEAENYYVHIHGRRFSEGRLTMRIALYKLEKLLPAERFFKISRSVIVNLHYIKRIRNNEITLKNEKKLTVTRSHKYITGLIENKLRLQ